MAGSTRRFCLLTPSSASHDGKFYVTIQVGATFDGAGVNMSSISKALEQMQRGLASEGGRIAVNNETIGTRRIWEQERNLRLKSAKTAPTVIQKSIQELDYGKLD